MDVRSLQEQMVQKYHERLRQLVVAEYRRDVNDAVLCGLDEAVIILSEEQKVSVIAQSIVVQLEWLGTTRYLVGNVLDLDTIPYTRRATDALLGTLSSQDDALFRKVVGLLDQLAHVRNIQQELTEMKKSCVSKLYWEIFRDRDHHSPSVKGVLLQQLECTVSLIPGTLGYTLVQQRRQLGDLFPEMNNEELRRKLAGCRCNLLADVSPSQMDDFKDKIVRIARHVMADSSADELISGTRETVLRNADAVAKETFTQI